MQGTIFQGMKLLGSKIPMTPAVRDAPKVETKKLEKPVVSTEKGEVKKKYRSQKEKQKELRKAQMSALDMFIESKPTKAKVREYFENRVKQLHEDD